ncbi:MAG: hypothetical protein RJQ04_03475 [Longimicrobiales bacterium]
MPSSGRRPAPPHVRRRVRAPARAGLGVAVGLLAAAPVLGQSLPCPLHRSLSPVRTVCPGPDAPFRLRALPDSTPVLGSAVLLPVRIDSYLRSAYPMDRENGGVWAGKGASGRVSLGVAGTWGRLTWSIHPELSASTNASFAIADTTVPGYAPEAYPWELVRIDLPQRPGPDALTRIGPGQSFVEVAGPARSRVRVSSENLVWGPSRRYPLLIGATAEGFPHLFVTSGRVRVGPVTAEAMGVFGFLWESDYHDRNPENDRQFLEAVRLELTMGRDWPLQVAVTSLVRQRARDRFQVTDLLEVFPTSSVQDATGPTVDALGALEWRWFADPVVVRGTWGRGDFFLDFEDLLTQPEHNQFWGLGADYRWDGGPSTDWVLTIEHASTAATNPQFGLRGYSSTVYRHAGLTQGHTNRGQHLGASIGPGSRATALEVSRVGRERVLRAMVEQIQWDLDTHRRTLRSEFGTDSRDTEYLLGGAVDLPGSDLGVPDIRVRGAAGLSARANRQFVRFTSGQSGRPKWETNLWLDVSLEWTPR